MREDGEHHDGHGDQKSWSQAATPKLADLGISRTQSSRWQKLAAIPEQQFEEQLEATKRKAVAAVDSARNPGLKRQPRAEKEADLAARTAAAGRSLGSEIYGVIYADPP